MTSGTIPARTGVIRRSDSLLAVAVVGIVAMMIVPLPPVVLDLLLIGNITLSLTILLVAMNVREPLEFSTFPSLLLVATLFRLALNVSAARLVLLEAHAGDVITAFGNVVVGGNTIVGIVVFLILIVIQYVVITSGAGRVSEVSARFTLDAMPGKQMSIDADLNAGLITAEEARARRRAIEREADFYGAMDGASKFVKGDAIAALVVIAVNIIGGLSIGLLQKGMDIGSAVTTYTVLTVGDGLTNEISALLMSTATAILVTRTASEVSMGSDLGGQLFARPRLLTVAGGVLVAVGLVPGFPTLLFVAAGTIIASAGLLLSRRAVAAAAVTVLDPELPAIAAPSANEAPLDALKVETMELEVGYGLLGLVESTTGGIVERIGVIRRQIAAELGLIVPTIRIRDDLSLAPEQYVIKLRGSEIERGQVYPSKLLCMDSSGGELAVDGIPATDPVFGLPAVWINPADRERADSLGYAVIDAASVLATHLAEAIRRHGHEILGRQETQQLLDSLREEQPALVDELIPNAVSLADFQKVLQGLLRERVPIRDLRTIAEAVADSSRLIKEPLLLTEAARHGLARTLTQRYRSPDGSLHAVAVAPNLDTSLGGQLSMSPGRVALDLNGAESRRLVESVQAAAEALTQQGYQPILLCTTRIRLALHSLLERVLPQLVVLSYEEILPGVPVQIHRQLEI